MTLHELLAETGDASQLIGLSGIQVFGTDPRYFRLTDYLVSSAISGPSYVLVSRNRAS